MRRRNEHCQTGTQMTRRAVVTAGVSAAANAVLGGSAAAAARAAGTIGEEATALRIALVADPHVTRGEDAQKRSYGVHFDRVIASVNAVEGGVDAVLVAGDLTDDGLPEQYDDFKARADRFRCPAVWSVPGNHDVGNKRREGADADGGTITDARLRRYEEKVGPSFWVRPLNDGTRVIGVNTPLLGSGLPREAEQWAFLEHELGATGDRRQTLVLLHYPLFTEAPDEPSSVYWNVEPAPRRRLLELLSTVGPSVRAVFSGHLHRPLERAAGNLRFLGAPPVSFGLPTGKQPEGWTLVTIPAAGPASARFVAVATDARRDA
jgi:alkaline phosphatase D